MYLNARSVGLHDHTLMKGFETLKAYGLFDRNVPRYTSYPTATHFKAQVEPDRQARWLQQLQPRQSISLYVHIPFCRRVCWFCACRTQGLAGDSRLNRYLDGLHREIAWVADRLPPGVTVSRLHLGGGTPTLLSPDQLSVLVGAIQHRFEFDHRIEFSVEIDPNEIDSERLAVLSHAGMNRASVGVQDFDPRVQQAIGRSQSYEITAQVVSQLRAHDIQSLNVDMLYGLPYQTEARLVRSIELLHALAPDRVALYGYAHVPWMAKRQILIPTDALPSTEARFYLAERAHSQWTSQGYEAIGIDHFARPDDGLARAKHQGLLRRNFQGYTDDTAPTLIGLGASAISKYPQGFIQNDPDTAGYLARIETGQGAGTRGHVFRGEDGTRARAIEMLLCDFAIDFHQLEAVDADGAAQCRQIASHVASNFGKAVSLSEEALAIPPAMRPLTRLIAQWFDGYEVASSAHSSAI